MATKNLIPRGSGEGGIGIENVTWGEAYFDTGNFNKGLYISGNPIDAVVSQTITQGGLGGKWGDGTTAGDIKYDGGNVGIGTANPAYQLQVGNLSATHSNDIAACFIGSTPQAGEGVGIQFGTDIQSCMSRIYSKVESTNNSMLEFQTMGDGSAETRMVINHTGNVGIGTANPDYAMLHIDATSSTTNPFYIKKGGDSYITCENGGDVIIGSLRFDNTNTPEVKSTSVGQNGSFTFYTSEGSQQPTGRMAINYNGVGIGTTDPSVAKLQIHGSSGTSVRAGLLLNDSNSGRSSAIHQVGDLLKFDDYTRGFTSIAINGLNGYVGIGTTSPGVKLEINGTAMINPTLTAGNNGGLWFGKNNTVQGYIGGGAFAVTGLNDDDFGISAATDGDLVFGTTTSIGGNDHERMRITSTGNVGIGTTNPDSQLSIITDNASNGYSMKVGAGGGGAEDKAIYIAAGKTVPTSAGDCVYIGFHDGDGSSSGGVRCSSISTTPELFSGSDVRMKKNIEDCDINGIEKIKSLKLRKWDWNTEKDMAPTDLGLIADELEEVYPELVSRQKMDGWEHCVSEGEEDLKTIPSESKITLTLIKAIQEQQQIIEDLKSRIETLENK